MITIHKRPEHLTPVYNPMVIVVSSTNQSQPSFNFIGEIYVGTDLVTKMKVPVSPDGYGHFDIHRHLENRLSLDFDPEGHGWKHAQKSYVNYNVKFKEEFRYEFEFKDNIFHSGLVGFVSTKSIPDGGEEPLFDPGDIIFINQEEGFTNNSYEGTTTVHSVVIGNHPAYFGGQSFWYVVVNKPWGSSSPADEGTIFLDNFKLKTIDDNVSVGTYRAFNGVKSFLDFIDYSYTPLIPDTTDHGKWMTTVPNNYKVDLDSTMFLNAFRNGTGRRRFLYIQTNKGTYRFENMDYTNTGVFQVGVGPKQLNDNLSNTTIVNGTFPIFDSNTKEYTVWTTNSSLYTDGEEITFKIDKPCSRYERIQLIFLDKMGSMIPHIFNLAYRHEKNIERTSYGKNYGKYSTVDSNWTYNSYDRGTTTVDIKVNEKYRLHTDWFNQDESDFFMELVESPEVYWVMNDGTTVAINVTNSNIERKQVLNDQIINYTLDFELSQKNMTQRG